MTRKSRYNKWGSACF